MRALTLILVVLLLFIQVPLWFSKGGWLKVREMQQQIEVLEASNADKELRNQALRSEVADLQSGKGAVEEEARYGLGLVKKNEVFIQILSQTTALKEGRSDSGQIQIVPPLTPHPPHPP